MKKKLQAALKNVSLLLLLQIILCLSITKVNAGTGLSGTYNVPSTYGTIGAAIKDLKKNGVSGPVVIDIAKGTYNETLSIGTIGGVSAANTITFQGAGIASTIITNSLTVDTISGSYIVFHDLTIKYSGAKSGISGTYLSGTYNSFINCKFIGSLGTNSGDLNICLARSASHNTIDSCYIFGGTYGIYSSTSTTGASNNVIENTRITQQYSYNIYIAYGTENTYNHNYIDSSASGVFSAYECGTNFINNTLPGDNEQTALTIEYPNNGTQADTFNIINNIIGPNFISQGFVLTDAGAKTGINVRILHNTIHSQIAIAGPGGGKICINNVCTGGSYYNFYMTDGCKGYDVRNNENSSSSGCNLWYCSSIADLSYENGNNFYTNGGHFVVGGAGTFNTLASYQSAVASYGFATNDENVAPTFVSATNLHYSQTVSEPYGMYCGVNTDIDGDPRCKLYPTIGADESNYGKGAFKTAIYGPAKAYVGSPTLFTNTALAGSPIIFAWYVNGVFVSDSISLQTNTLKAPGDSIKLVETGCTGTDSATIYQVVDTPAKPPVTGFLSNLNVVGQGELVSFRDLSTNGPTKWSWSISPEMTYDPDQNSQEQTYSYINCDSSSQNPQLKFYYTGMYNVCLTASNARGKGNTVCKNRYIDVTAMVDMCYTSSSNASSGVLYDNGGTGPTQTTNGATCSFLLAPCSDTVYFIFDSFAMGAGNSYLRIFDGSNNTGNVINGTRSRQCIANVGTNGGPGFTGGYTGAFPNLACLPVIGDTFKAVSGQMYFEFSSSGTSSPGFRGHWWGHPKPFSPPKAKFTMSSDSVCVNGTINFYADTTVGKDMTFLWDIDGDTVDGFQTGGKNASWSYFETGDYTVLLVASNCGGSDTMRQTVSVYFPPAPDATFSANTTNPTLNDIVTFSPTEMMCIDNYIWTFTGPNGALSTFKLVNGTSKLSEYPQVIFNDTGCWSVTLYENNNLGQDSDIKTINCYIHVKTPYCTPSVGFPASDIGLNDLSFNTLNNPDTPSTVDRTGYNNFIPKLSTTLQQGLKYTLKLSRATNYDSVDISVWVDWKGDENFSDSGDLVLNLSNQAGLSWVDSNITIPHNAVLGATIMRVALNMGGLGNVACGQNAYGDYEDYRLYLERYSTPPVITLKGPDTVIEQEGLEYKDPGYAATSELYGDITQSVTLTWVRNGVTLPKGYGNLYPGTYIVTYNVTDPSGNPATPVTRVVIEPKDTVPPVLEIECPGTPDTVYLQVHNTFIDPAPCKDSDYVDGILQNQPDSIIGSVNTNKLGTYILTYYSSDLSSNMAIAKLTVIVEDTFTPQITLKKGAHDTIAWNVNTPFTATSDDSVIVADAYYGAKVPLVISGSLNVNVPGIYAVTYNATDSSGNKAAPFTLYVIVTSIPTLNIFGADSETVEAGVLYTDPGYFATDAYYKKVTVTYSGSFYTSFLAKSYPDGIPTRLGQFALTYTATNQAGTSVSQTRDIYVEDKLAPVITLKGSQDTNVCRWQPYTDPGYTVTDNYTPQNKIKITPHINVNISVPDIYSVSYVATDSVGNTATSVTRTVNVTQEGNCTTGINNNKTLGDYINLYPNPTTGEFVIDMNLPKQENVLITITNAMGQVVQKVYSGQSSGSQAVDMSGAASGMYFVNITTNNETVTKKITIAK